MTAIPDSKTTPALVEISSPENGPSAGVKGCGGLASSYRVTLKLGESPSFRAVLANGSPSDLAPTLDGTEVSTPGPQSSEPARATPSNGGKHILIVDDEEEIRTLCRAVFAPIGIRCDVAASGAEALNALATQSYDLVLLDMAMPGLSGQEVCRRLRANPPTANLKVVIFSGHMAAEELAQMLAAGADDYITKPFSIVELAARIQAALRLKEAQDRADLLSHRLIGTNQHLELNLHARNRDLIEAHKALVLALAKLVECRDSETGAHIQRLQAYCVCLAEQAAQLPAFAGRIDSQFLGQLAWSAPLHDIGKAGIPDAILRKEGPLTAEERRVMQTHTILGAQTLTEVARQHGSGMSFLQMAIDVARHHHERYDGTGYPDRKAGTDIPLAARIVAIADVYDALRSRRVYKPAHSHAASMHLMLAESPGQFDPALLQAFQHCADDFDRIYTERAE